MCILEVQLQDKQDEMMSTSVKIGTLTFVSRLQTKACMDLNGVLERVCLFFIDAMSMLALMHNGSESVKATAELLQ